MIFPQNNNVGLIRVIERYFSPNCRSKALIFVLLNYLIADMIYTITEQCMDIEWARCKEMPISRHSMVHTICIGNHIISSAIWDKSARVNFSKANQIARARRASAICSL